VKRVWIALLWAAWISTASAEEMIMARVTRPFPETISAIEAAIRAQGYTVSRIQRVDVGLTTSGFQTAEYRVVFYGKAQEIEALAKWHPELIPYLPLNIIVFAEGDDTLLLATNPLKLGEFFKNPELRPQFSQWERDLRLIFREMTQ
jgi:uncharacterized protein (DUF302 family)